MNEIIPSPEQSLEQKYLALLDEANRRQLPDVGGIRLCFQLLSVAAAIDRDCAALLAPHGLSEGRFILLFLLDAAEQGLPPNLLAERAGVSRATVTGLVDGLEREGLVERRAELADRRSLAVCLTPAGKRLAGRLFAQHAQWIAGLLGDIDAEERRVLSSLLARVAARTGAVAAGEAQR